MQFSLYDGPSSGTQIATVSRTGVSVTNGTFTVQLDFGPAAFPGADRYLEIALKKPADTTYTTLTPRQQVTSTPYSIRALNATNADTATNATQLNGTPASSYVQTSDSRLSDARTPTPGSTDYIQNKTTQQASANFNISGTGTANILAATQYNIGVSRILGSPGRNLFVGVSVAELNSGDFNTFIGTQAAFQNLTGSNNSFVGYQSGLNSSFGNSNSFFGANAGQATNQGDGNSFVGFQAGYQNNTGSNNSFFGYQAGFNNITSNGSRTGNANSFFGLNAGGGNRSGSNNTIIGSGADLGASDLNFATAIGSGAVVGTSNTVVIGRSIDTVAVGTLNSGSLSANSFVNAGTQYNLGGDQILGNAGTDNLFAGVSAGTNNTGNSNAFFGASAGGSNSTGSENSFIGTRAGSNNKTGIFNTFVGSTAGGHNDNGGLNAFVGAFSGLTNVSGGNITLLGASADVGVDGLDHATAIGANSSVSTSNTIALGRTNGSDHVRIYGLGAAGSTALCLNASNEISGCSSSLRYKTNVAPFASGLAFINKLRPISFDWKAGGTKDVGFGAEDVARIDPRFVTYNAKGEVEGVKYDRFSVLFVNAIKEQQRLIEEQKAKIDDDQKRISSLESANTALDARLKAIERGLALKPRMRHTRRAAH
jgi:hypothetical protein